MSIPGSASPLLLASTAAAAGGLQIQRSLRFNSADSATLSRTPAVAGNRRTWTWSGWVKRVFFGQSFEYLFDAGTTDNFGFTNNSAYMYFGSGPGFKTASATFRDPSAWLHYLIHLDSTNATAEDRCQIWINGVRLTSWSSNPTISLNFEGTINSTVAHTFANAPGYSFMNTYLANVHFIDGQALTPSSFTETDATTGQLIPKTYTGSYGTNGFNLLFADNSSNTASTLGKDTSGLSNNWTPNNLSVTAGAGNDSLVDSPTNYGTDTGVGGEVRGNYCTLNPLDPAGGYPLTLANGNLETTAPSSQWRWRRATWALTSGKWYWEHTVGSGNYFSGVVTPSWDLNITSYTGMYGRQSTDKYNNGTTTSPFSSTTGGDILMYALDVDSGNMWVGKNGTWNGSGDPGAGTNPDWTGVPIGVSPFAAAYQVTNILNFGQRAFAYTNNRTGFKALCTQNLPATLVTKSNTVMDVALYTGNGAANTITGLAFSPDLVWMKVRSTAYNHTLIDSVRGATKTLSSSMTVQEYTEPTGPTAFTADGWSMSGDVTYVGSVNASGQTYVGWAWDAGTSTVSNTQGSITSQVRANATAGFSVVAFNSGSGAPTAYTVGHGLNVAPQFIIAKSRTSAAYNWSVYHTSIATTTNKYLSINTTAATQDNGTSIWGAAQPTSTVFGITSGNAVVANTDCIAYCFAPVVGYSSFGSYTGNGSSDGPFVYTGFRPRYLCIKSSSFSDQWLVLDAARNAYNVVNLHLHPNLANNESSFDWLDFTANGFKIRTTYSTVNQSSGSFIYFAFAESPFNYARAR